MATGEERKCPDCATALQPIRIIDKAHGYVHADFEYSLAEAQRGFWLDRFAVEGRVLAYMCDRCGRILLYGEPSATA